MYIAEYPLLFQSSNSFLLFFSLLLLYIMYPLAKLNFNPASTELTQRRSHTRRDFSEL